jgi:hypothetical protein
MTAFVLALALAQDGAKEWTRCASCHTTPDATYGADRKFLKLIEKTA